MKWFTGVSLLALGLMLLPACADDNNEAVAPVFPEKVAELSVASAGEQAEFAFKANTDWTLTSSKLWCKFVSGKESVPMLAGAAGEQKVQIVVTDDIWDFEAATAEVSLNMEGQSKVVAKVTRGAKGLVIEGYDKDHPVTISYIAGLGGQTTILVDANFDWELTQKGVPSWLNIAELPIKGYAGRALEVQAAITPEAKVTAQSGKLVFAQLDTEASYEIPVTYTGMGDKDIELSLNNVWNWNVSKEGDSYWSGSLTGDTDVEKKNFPLDIKVTVKNNDYEVVRMFVKDGSLMESDQWNGGNFFMVNDDQKGNLSVPAIQANTGTEREGYILTFPRYVFETELQGDAGNAVDSEDWSAIKEEYTKYIAWNFVQESAVESAGGFEVIQGGVNSLECMPGDNGTGYGEMISGATGVSQDQIFFVKVSAGAYLQVNPMLQPAQWDPTITGMAGVMAMSMEGDDYTQEWTPNMNTAGAYVLEGNVNKTMFISFPDNSQGFPMPCKALLIIVE